MSIDRRQYHRVLTDVLCRFGREQDMNIRQVNISAGGAAFVVMPEMRNHFQEGDILPFAFELKMRHFEFQSKVIRCSGDHTKQMAAIQFLEVEDHVRRLIDDMVLALGGYHKDDHDKKREYLGWYAPQMLHPKPATHTSTEPTPTPPVQALAEESTPAIDLPLASAEDIEKFGDMSFLDELLFSNPLADSQD